MIELNDKVVVITGASRGIGLNIMTTFENNGAKVIPIARSLGCDVTNEGDIQKVTNSLDRIDILVNCAGLFSMSSLEKDNLFDEIMNTNVKGTINCIKSVLPIMKKQKSGKIINILSDVLTDLPPVGFSEYTANKAYIESLSKSWNVEYAKYGITSRNVYPSMMRTNLITTNIDSRIINQLEDQTPLGKFISTKEVAIAIKSIISD